MKTTQENTILKALQEHPEGLHPTYFISDLHIYQYNARINGLRERFDCNCKGAGKVCFAREHIKNKRMPNGTTRFYYKQDESKLEEYQEYFKTARLHPKHTGDGGQKSLWT